MKQKPKSYLAPLILLLSMNACQASVPEDRTAAQNNCPTPETFAEDHRTERVSIRGIGTIDTRYFHLEGCEGTSWGFADTPLGEGYAGFRAATRLSRLGKAETDYVGFFSETFYGAWEFDVRHYDNPRPIAPTSSAIVDMSTPVEVDFCNVMSVLPDLRGQPITVSGYNHLPDVPAIWNAKCPQVALPLILGEDEIEPDGYRELQTKFAFSECPRVEADYTGIAYRTLGGGVEFDILKVENPRLIEACELNRLVGDDR